STGVKNREFKDLCDCPLRHVGHAGVKSMIRKFWNDRRGNYIMMTAVAVVPIMGAMALAVDYTEMSRQRQATLNALDAAGIATARRLVEGATDEEAKTY